VTAKFKDLQLSKFAEEGAELEIRDAAGAPTGWHWRLRGLDAPELRQLQLAQRRHNLELLAKGNERVDPSLRDEQTLELLAAATMAWRGCEMEAGVPFECTPSNVRAALAETYIREQVADFINTRANFLPRSASAS
jgi:hypothetical protein